MVAADRVVVVTLHAQLVVCGSTSLTGTPPTLIYIVDEFNKDIMEGEGGVCLD